jgi:hypothetical protein
MLPAMARFRFNPDGKELGVVDCRIMISLPTTPAC